jgi:hypothetical protein
MRIRDGNIYATGREERPCQKKKTREYDSVYELVENIFADSLWAKQFFRNIHLSTHETYSFPISDVSSDVLIYKTVDLFDCDANKSRSKDIEKMFKNSVAYYSQWFRKPI